MKAEMLAVPGAAMTTGQVPAPFGYFIITGDWRCFIFYILIFVLFWFTWFPFFKAYEKSVVSEEEKEALELEGAVQ